jgi:predicted signal transduction protein with EAL and GGDEF domain
MSSKFIKSLVNEMEFERNVETIKVLLDDYEDQGAGFIWEIGVNQDIVNPSSKFSLGLLQDASAVAGTNFANWFRNGPETTKLKKYLKQGASFRNLEVPIIIDQTEHWWRLNARAVKSAGSLISMRGVATDITEEKLAKNQVSYLSTYDKITGFANREIFINALDRILKKKNESTIAIAIFSVENVDEICGVLVSKGVDEIVKILSNRLEACQISEYKIARFSDSKFICLVNNKEHVNNIEKLVESAIDNVGADIRLGNRIAQPHINSGIAIYPIDGHTSSDLINNANLALADSVSRGRGYSTFFDPSMEAAAIFRRFVESGLVDAVEQGQMYLVYQPIIDTISGRVVGMEALIRWNHLEIGNIPPFQFIEIAENTGKIIEIGNWIIKTAVDKVAKLDKNVIMSVNISPMQLKNPTFIKDVEEILFEAKISPNQIEFEVTEGIFIDDNKEIISILNGLIDRGFRVALDDFGTGYSSLSYIQKFSFTKIKIDQSFTKNIAVDPVCRAIVGAIISVADAVGVITTAEGVEDHDQFLELSRLGCTQMQGYLFGEPTERIERLSTPDTIDAPAPSLQPSVPRQSSSSSAINES